MKIAFFHELDPGGARRSVNEFSKYLREKHTVDLYVVDRQENLDERKFFDKVFFYKFIQKKWSGKDWKSKLYKDTVELYKLYNLHKKIAKKIESKKYDIIFIEPSRFTQAPFILRFLRTKKIYYCQEALRMVYEKQFAIQSELHPAKALYERLNRFIRKYIDKSNIKFADMILANSMHTKSNIKKAYNLDSHVSYMGVDPKIFYPLRIRKTIDILFVGAYEESDGYKLLSKAVEFLNPKPVIKVLAREKQWITNDSDMRELYSKTKIVVAFARLEPFGLIPLEAAACGTPVLAVNEGGYRESVVNGKTGFLVTRNPKVIADKISLMLQDSKAMEDMGKWAREYILKFWGWKKRTEELEKIIYGN